MFCRCSTVHLNEFTINDIDLNWFFVFIQFQLDVVKAIDFASIFTYARQSGNTDMNRIADVLLLTYVHVKENCQTITNECVVRVSKLLNGLCKENQIQIDADLTLRALTLSPDTNMTHEIENWRDSDMIASLPVNFVSTFKDIERRLMGDVINENDHDVLTDLLHRMLELHEQLRGNRKEVLSPSDGVKAMQNYAALARVQLLDQKHHTVVYIPIWELHYAFEENDNELDIISAMKNFGNANIQTLLGLLREIGIMEFNSLKNAVGEVSACDRQSFSYFRREMRKLDKNFMKQSNNEKYLQFINNIHPLFERLFAVLEKSRCYSPTLSYLKMKFAYLNPSPVELFEEMKNHAHIYAGYPTFEEYYGRMRGNRHELQYGPNNEFKYSHECKKGVFKAALDFFEGKNFLNSIEKCTNRKEHEQDQCFSEVRDQALSVFESFEDTIFHISNCPVCQVDVDVLAIMHDLGLPLRPTPSHTHIPAIGVIDGLKTLYRKVMESRGN